MDPSIQPPNCRIRRLVRTRHHAESGEDLSQLNAGCWLCTSVLAIIKHPIRLSLVEHGSLQAPKGCLALQKQHLQLHHLQLTNIQHGSESENWDHACCLPHAVSTGIESAETIGIRGSNWRKMSLPQTENSYDLCVDYRWCIGYQNAFPRVLASSPSGSTSWRWWHFQLMVTFISSGFI